MKSTLLFIILTSASLSLFAQNVDEEVIRTVIHEQELAWNKGSIDTFMQGYYNSDSLMFVGKNGIIYGWQNALNNYKKNYADTVAMGKLQLNLLNMKQLSQNYYFVTGKWHLTRTIGDVGGYFTLLFKKINGKWLIIVDHTS